MPVSLKVTDELKKRVSAVVAGTDKSAHAFMVQAIEAQTALAEKRKAFVADALRSRAEFRNTRLGYAAEDVHRYLEAQLAGKKPPPLKAKKWRE